MLFPTEGEDMQRYIVRFGEMEYGLTREAYKKRLLTMISMHIGTLRSLSSTASPVNCSSQRKDLDSLIYMILPIGS